MPQIIDNRDERLADALNEALEHAVALDACVGYLNLRGWSQIANRVAEFSGLAGRAPARVLIGMAARPEQLVRQAYRLRADEEDVRITNKEAVRLRAEALADFRDQLLVGAPTDAQEKALRQLPVPAG